MFVFAARHHLFVFITLAQTLAEKYKQTKKATRLLWQLWPLKVYFLDL